MGNLRSKSMGLCCRLFSYSFIILCKMHSKHALVGFVFRSMLDMLDETFRQVCEDKGITLPTERQTRRR